MGAEEQEEGGAAGRKPQKTSKEVYFCVLPDKYQPLIEEEERDETREEREKRREEKRKKRKTRFKKYRKNVGGALRLGWRCLLTGLQSMASTYSTPLSAVATVATQAQRAAGSNA